MIIGLTFGDVVKAYLFNAITVAIALIVGGFIILWAERRKHLVVSSEVDDLTFKQATLIGLIQCFALIPGTSRSGSTIIGSLFLGISRKAAAEFSFFLGIPVMFGASLLKIVKFGLAFTSTQLIVLIVGMVVSFLVSIGAIKFLLGYIKKNDFKAFGVYRIILGLLVIVYFAFIK